MNVTLRKIGNSEGVILPKELLERLNLKAGDSLTSSRTEGLARAEDGDFERQMKTARERMKKYEVALSELAK